MRNFFFKFVGRMLGLKQLGARLASTSAASGTTKSQKLLDSVIRVDHAGELGADRIYAGQMAVLGINKIRISGCSCFLKGKLKSNVDTQDR